MSGIIDKIVEKLAAGWLSRKCGKYSALVAAIIGAFAVFIASVGQSIQPLPQYAHYGQALMGAAAVLSVIAGLMGHQKKGEEDEK